MASVNFPSARLFSFQYDPVIIAGSFQVDNVTPTLVDATRHTDGLMPDTIAGGGANPWGAYNGVGDYTINLRDRYNHMIGGSVTLEYAAGTPNEDLVPRFGVNVFGAAAANTVQICLTTTAGPALADPATNLTVVNYILILSNNQQDM
jgi:hypothetical protein